MSSNGLFLEKRGFKIIVVVLYRKYRPQKISEIIGQPSITESLLKALQGGKISHAYLFTGSRGTGKTSLARILAKAINCQKAATNKEELRKFGEPCNNCSTCKAITEGRYLDLIEIDAASNRGIDEIRDLREKIKLSPIQGEYKVYIIDEAHMLTTEAFNALLKTLEEPPPHGIFILATTEPHKLPLTIVSRTQRFDFKVASEEDILEKLKLISTRENFKIEGEGLKLIAKAATGAYRDAEVLLEKISAVNPQASLAQVEKILGKNLVNGVEFLNLILSEKVKEAFSQIQELQSRGGNLRVLVEEILEALRKILLVKKGAGDLIEDKKTSDFEKIRKISESISEEKLLKLINLFTQGLEGLKTAIIPELPLEVAIVEATMTRTETETKPNLQAKTNVESVINLESAQVIEEAAQKEGEGEKKAKSKKGLSIEKIKDKWSQVLRATKDQNPSLEALLRDGIPLGFEDGTLLLEFNYLFHKDKIADRKNRELLEGILEDIFKSPILIRCILREKTAAKVKPAKKAAATETDTKKEDKDPLDLAVDFFGEG